MSRSGYVEDFDCDDDLAHGRYRGQVASAFRGKRGQDFFKESLDALQSMPVKELEAKTLRTQDGGFCLLGAVIDHRGLILAEAYDGDEDQCDYLSAKLGVAHQMIREIIWANDEDHRREWGEMHYRYSLLGGKSEYVPAFGETKGERWMRMRDWIKNQINEKD